MVINTGCRTDIPAFYAKWFINRIKEGYVLVRNPYYPSQVTKYILSKDKVDCLAFCTKNPEPMFKYLDKLKEFKQYWFVTITPYGKDIEPYVPDKNKVVEYFKILSSKIGINSIGWRYDPIFLNNEFNIKKHILCFEKFSKMLSGYTKNCTISFIDEYERVKKNAPDLKPLSKLEQIEIAKAFSKIGEKYGIKIHSCCENDYLLECGIDVNGCMSKEIVEMAIGDNLVVPKEKNIRRKCDCVIGKDIGAYNTCKHMCKYCYANYSKEAVLENVKKHDDNSPFIIGSIEEGDVIKEARQKSWILKKDNQMSFWNKI